MSRAERVAALQVRLGHVFRDQALLMRALTHKSAGDGQRGFQHNERLEWLGDRVLGLMAAERLHALHARDAEGELTRRFNAIVSGANCAVAAQALGMDGLVAVSKGIGATQGLSGTSILADAYEALLGALYLDGGFGAATVAFDAAWDAGHETAFTDPSRNPKSTLQEWAQKRGHAPPVYEVLDRDGPDHSPVFTVRCVLGRRTIEAAGPSKQAAERSAAIMMLKGLDSDG
jgi:ribonuclease III